MKYRKQQDRDEQLHEENEVSEKFLCWASSKYTYAPSPKRNDPSSTMFSGQLSWDWINVALSNHWKTKLYKISRDEYRFWRSFAPKKMLKNPGLQ